MLRLEQIYGAINIRDLVINLSYVIWDLDNRINKKQLALFCLQHKESQFSIPTRAQFHWECPIGNWKRLGNVGELVELNTTGKIVGYCKPQ